jgi:hypothetical protein
MLPLLDKGSRFESHDFLFGDFVFSNFDLHLKKLISTYSKGFSWKIWPTLAKFQEKMIARFSYNAFQ